MRAICAFDLIGRRGRLGNAGPALMELLIAWLKAIHIAALLVWIAGLFYLPVALFAHAEAGSSREFIRVRAASRFAQTALAAPAAVVAIAAGTGLLIFGDALGGWMFVKLALVIALVVGHLQFGAVLGRMADRSARLPRARLAAVFVLNAIAMALILFLVLAEPRLLSFETPPAWLQPGGLQSLLGLPMPI